MGPLWEKAQSQNVTFLVLGIYKILLSVVDLVVLEHLYTVIMYAGALPLNALKVINKYLIFNTRCDWKPMHLN